MYTASKLNYEIHGDRITVFDTENFVPKHILECGQLFRYVSVPESKGNYKIFAKSCFCLLQSKSDCVIMDTSCGEFFKDYFDLDADYAEVKRKVLLKSGAKSVKEAVNNGYGIRLLRQDPTEALISFIISANNNIPRIKGIIERLCEQLGKDCGGYRAFPTVEALADASEKFYQSIGAGYRAPYIKKTAQMLRDGFDLAGLCRKPSAEVEGKSTAEARRELMTLMGVGRKVADCVLLFGLGRRDVFPIDVWTERVFRDLYPNDAETDRAKMSDRLTKLFGDVAGYAQQYLYYERQNRA